MPRLRTFETPHLTSTVPARLQANMHEACACPNRTACCDVQVTALAQPCMLEEVSKALTVGRPLAELSDRELVLMDATMARLTQLARAAHKARQCMRR